MMQFQARLAGQSTGFAPSWGNMPATAPWAGTPQPGTLQSAAGFGDVGNYGATLPAGF